MVAWLRVFKRIPSVHPLWFIPAVIVAVGLAVWWTAPGPAVTVIPPTTPSSATITLLQEGMSRQQKVLLDVEVRSAQLLEEVKALRATIETMTTSIATLKVTAGGKFVPVPGPAGPPGPAGAVSAPAPPASNTPPIDAPPAANTPTTYNYTDWRLSFTGDVAKQTATYTLTQRFEIAHLTGRQKDGKPVSLLKVFELGPGDTKTPMPAVTRTTVVDDAVTRWHLSPTVQVGVGVVQTPTLPIAPTRAAIIGLQLWKRGKSAAAEDSTMSIFTPVAVANSSGWSVGVSPMSLNLGHLPYQPFKDLWLAPFATWSGKVRVGVGLLASF